MFGKKKKLQAMSPEEAYQAAEGFKKEKKALSYCLYAAEKGHLEAQKRVARHYERGIKARKNFKKALYWYEKAAKQGDPWAQIDCGDFYKKGQGCKADPEQAFYWYTKAAEQNHEWGMNKLAEAYEKGLGCAVDMEKALQWHTRAGVAGNRFSANRAAKLYEDSGDLEMALYFRVKVRDFHEKELDDRLKKGYNHIRDYELINLKLAQEEVDRIRAAMGLPAEPEPELKPVELPPHNEFNRMAILQGQNCEATDPAQALQWYEQAAKRGDYLAQFNCGRMYYDGDGCEVDKEKALYWFEKAADQGDLDAQFNCGVMYENGEGCEDEIFRKSRALYWYERAAKQGRVDTMVFCANAYFKGDGCPKNEERAYYWYEKAAERGNEQAAHNLSVMGSREL